jgi:predicted NAD-dependent protein-ADP-ribosyltransferase YbiA (DUF1768 family)
MSANAPLNISSKSDYPARELSNFTARTFVLDGVTCYSIEGVLQAVKFEERITQKRICQMTGAEAKASGKLSNWKDTQILWWRGVAMGRESQEYQNFLTRLFRAVFDQDPSFRKALATTGTRKLTHSMGKSNLKVTVLTEQEFCSLLSVLRANIPAVTPKAIPNSISLKLLTPEQVYHALQLCAALDDEDAAQVMARPDYSDDPEEADYVGYYLSDWEGYLESVAVPDKVNAFGHPNIEDCFKDWMSGRSDYELWIRDQK